MVFGLGPSKAYVVLKVWDIGSVKSFSFRGLLLWFKTDLKYTPFRSHVNSRLGCSWKQQKLKHRQNEWILIILDFPSHKKTQIINVLHLVRKRVTYRQLVHLFLPEASHFW